jgi:predicted MFS family arabinose efflux permease
MTLPGSRPPDYRSLFTVSFTALLAGQIVSILGDRLNNIAMIELLASETGRFAETGSTFELSKLAFAMTLPALVFGPFVGAYVDRVSRKQVLILTDIIRGLAVLAIPFMRPSLPLWTVYGIVAVLYLANLFFLPARCAIVTEIVSKDRLIKANSMLSLGATAATIAGFVAGGVIATKAGWRTALFIDSATYFFSAAALVFIRIPRPGMEQPSVEGEPADTGRHSYMETIKEAVRIVRHSPIARLGVMVPPVMVLAGTTAYVLGVTLIESRIPEGTMYIGFLIGLAGAGMGAGSFFTGKVLHSQPLGRTAVIWIPAAIVPMMAIGFTESLPLLGLAMFVAGFAAGPVFVSTETAVQHSSPPRRQATVFALRDMQMKLAIVVAAGLSSVAAGALGAGTALVALLVVWLLISLPIIRTGTASAGAQSGDTVPD